MMVMVMIGALSHPPPVKNRGPSRSINKEGWCDRQNKQKRGLTKTIDKGVKQKKVGRRQGSAEGVKDKMCALLC